eukprot:scaffold2485_cov143-Skeletonema_menzelii.AAC.6
MGAIQIPPDHELCTQDEPPAVGPPAYYYDSEPLMLSLLLILSPCCRPHIPESIDTKYDV